MASNATPARNARRTDKGKGRERQSHRTGTRLDDAEDHITARFEVQEGAIALMQEQIFTDLAGEQEVIAQAEAHLRKFENVSAKNFPEQIVKCTDGECLFTKGSAPVSYVAIVSEVVRRAEPDNVEMTVYAPIAAPTLELVNLEMVYGGFNVDKVVNEFVPVLNNAGLPLINRFIKSLRLVDRKKMLHHRAMTFFVLANHPFWAVNPDKHVELRTILAEFYDRLYSNRIERLIFGHSLEPGVSDLKLGNDLTYPDYTTMNHMRKEHADEVEVANWAKVEALCQGDELVMFGEDIKGYGWSY